MKKFTLLSSITLLTALFTAQVQAETQTQPTADAAAAATDAKAKPTKPKLSPQVAKLMNQYPNLIARIHPYGRVCYEGEDCDITITALAAAVDGQPRDGKTIYEAICSTCHGMGLAGSPKFGDAGAWGPRIAKGKDTLYDSAINGFKAMPARGGADLADEEVKNAVDYMVKNAS